MPISFNLHTSVQNIRENVSHVAEQACRAVVLETEPREGSRQLDGSAFRGLIRPLPLTQSMLLPAIYNYQYLSVSRRANAHDIIRDVNNSFAWRLILEANSLERSMVCFLCYIMEDIPFFSNPMDRNTTDSHWTGFLRANKL